MADRGHPREAWARAVWEAAEAAGGGESLEWTRRKKGGPLLRNWLYSMLALMLLGTPWRAFAASWETGAKVGFDSNVNLSMDQEESEGWVSAYLSFFREPSGESRVDWTLASSLEGTAYLNLSDLYNAAITISPGLSFVPSHPWSLQVAPFFEAKAVRDSEQSALSFGGKVSLGQRLGRNWYSGQYYLYQDSRAEVDTYSFTEHAVGIYLGASWTSALFTELGYEFSHGDSFLTLTSSEVTVQGKGRHRHYSQTFSGYVVRDTVDRHQIGVTVGIDWTRSVFSQAGYTFTLVDGDLGSMDVHETFAGVGWRF